jgi:hypothetical protein
MRSLRAKHIGHVNPEKVAIHFYNIVQFGASTPGQVALLVLPISSVTPSRYVSTSDRSRYL